MAPRTQHHVSLSPDVTYSGTGVRTEAVLLDRASSPRGCIQLCQGQRLCTRTAMTLRRLTRALDQGIFRDCVHELEACKRDAKGFQDDSSSIKRHTGPGSTVERRQSTRYQSHAVDGIPHLQRQSELELVAAKRYRLLTKRPSSRPASAVFTRERPSDFSCQLSQR